MDAGMDGIETREESQRVRRSKYSSSQTLALSTQRWYLGPSL